MNTAPAIQALKSESGLTETESEAAEILQKYFKSVFAVEGSEVIPTFTTKLRPDQILREIEINRETVKKELERLNEHKAPGPDGIPNIVLRRCAEELAVPLGRLFNRTMEEGKSQLNGNKPGSCQFTRREQDVSQEIIDQ